MWEPAFRHPGVAIANRRVRSGFSMARVAVHLLMSMICADLSLHIWVFVCHLTVPNAAFFASTSAFLFPGISWWLGIQPIVRSICFRLFVTEGAE
jgi:hypothetical protein